MRETISLMSRISKHIFGTCNAVVLDSSFCVDKCITEVYAKGVYTGSLIKKRSYFTKGVLWDLVDTHFHVKEVGDADMIEAITQENKPF